MEDTMKVSSRVVAFLTIACFSLLISCAPLFADEGAARGKEVKIAEVKTPAMKPVQAPSSKGKVETIKERAKRLFNEGKLDESMAIWEDIQKKDGGDLDAKRFIKAITVEKRRLAERDQWNTQKDMILDVRRSWNPPAYGKDDGAAGTTFEGRRMKSERQEEMEKKSNQVIPEINFTDAQLSDVLKYLSSVSGINIIFDEQILKGGGIDRSDETEEVGVGEEKKVEASAGGGASSASDRVSISLKNVPLIEALRYILSSKGLKYRIDEYAILVSTPSRLENVEMETRYYHLSSGSGVFSAITKKSISGDEGDEAVSGGSTEGESSMTIKDVLEQSGVPFPPGSKIFLDQRTGTLIVRNTPANLAVVEKILGALDVPPFQVAIEAKFVEVSEQVMQELGLEAYLNSNFGLEKKGYMQVDPGQLGPGQSLNSSAMMATTGVNAAGGNQPVRFSNGMRFLQNYAADGTWMGAAGSVFSIATLSQPQLQFVLHALDQCGVANMLSAPKVTTVNNQQAKIEVVTEVIYPSEFEITPPTTNNNGNVITPAVVIPSAFTTRDTGIILEVTPSVGADRKTINLTLIPEVSELASWMDYGIPATTGAGGVIITNKVPVLQPFFSTRNVTTSVIINDGETVVLGGLIRDVTTRFNDKIPLLGDIPGIGRAFRNEGEVSTKRNLLIFVTAHLLTPNGDKLIGAKMKKTKIFNP